MRTARYRQILSLFRRLIGGVIWWDFILPRLGLGGLSRRTRSGRLRQAAVAYRALAVRLGGVLIKVGQLLSSRLDVLPREITAELAGLQDEVGAEPLDDIRGVLETELGGRLEEIFVEFDPLPLASASIGQVHRAALCRSSPQGTPCPPVVVKVQRPRIREIVEADLEALRVVGGWLGRFRSVRRHADIPALIEELSRSLHEETDYLHEGRNAERFAESFRDQAGVRVPKVLWSHTTRRVLTLEDVAAIKIGDTAAIEAAGIDRAAVARRLVDSYLKQIFEDGFFHADPHPGNLFIHPASPGAGSDGWQLVFIDFGMTGTLPAETYAALREALVAFGTRDAVRLVAAYRRLDILLPGVDQDRIERATRQVFDRLWGKSTREMMQMRREEARRFAREFGDLLYEMPFQVPGNLILLGRCLSILSGLAFGLDPEFNFWQVAEPHARKLMEAGGESGMRLVLREIAEAARLLAALPRRTDALLNRLEQGRLEVRIPELRQQVARLERSARKLAGAIVFAAGLLAGTQLFLGGEMKTTLVLGLLEGALLAWLLFGR